MAHESESDKANGVEREREMGEKFGVFKRGGTRERFILYRERERERLESREWNDHN